MCIRAVGKEYQLFTFTNSFKKHTLKMMSVDEKAVAGLEWNIQRRMRQNGCKQQNADRR